MGTVREIFRNGEHRITAHLNVIAKGCFSFVQSLVFVKCLLSNVTSKVIKRQC